MLPHLAESRQCKPLLGTCPHTTTQSSQPNLTTWNTPRQPESDVVPVATSQGERKECGPLVPRIMKISSLPCMAGTGLSIPRAFAHWSSQHQMSHAEMRRSGALCPIRHSARPGWEPGSSSRLLPWTKWPHPCHLHPCSILNILRQ